MTTMDRDEALKLLRGGPEGIAEWNRLRVAGEDISDQSGVSLFNANLSSADLSHANLSGTRLSLADLRHARLCNANLEYANFGSADLGSADLSHANLRHANLCDTNLRNANLSDADISTAILWHVKLSNAKLCGADLSHADIRYANLSDANLKMAILTNALLRDTNLSGADFTKTTVGSTSFAGVDLSQVNGLRDLSHIMRSAIDTSTLVASRGQVPEVFLRGCGLAPWEVIAAKLYNPELSAEQITDVQYKIFEARTSGPVVLGGVFISYSRNDAKFVDKMRDKLTEKGIAVWLDRHDLIAGPLDRQIDRALRMNDVVLLVLSEHSINSEWVERELKTTLAREKKEKRDILCPVAVDVSWKGRMRDKLWQCVEKKNVLDFAKWKTKAFDGQFQKLLKGLKIYYEKPNGAKKSVAS